MVIRIAELWCEGHCTAHSNASVTAACTSYISEGPTACCRRLKAVWSHAPPRHRPSFASSS